MDRSTTESIVFIVFLPFAIILIDYLQFPIHGISFLNQLDNILY